MSKKLLFVNACIRDSSRTEALSRQYLKTIENDYQIKEIRLSDLNLEPFDAKLLKLRDQDIFPDKVQEILQKTLYFRLMR